MVLPNLSFTETVFVLDLDDTLYQEVDYQFSGFKEVLCKIRQIYGKNLDEEFNKLIQKGSSDVLQSLCDAAGLPDTVKESLLWIYRLHQPNISLVKDVRDFISFLQQDAAGVAILTDGRSFSQRSKLKALGLSRLPAYISEEYGDMKPSPLRFEAIMRDMPAIQYLYVADNPERDFLAPNTLGWKTVGLLGGAQNIHSQAIEDLPEEYLPSLWIDSLKELVSEKLC
jgi:putative hydrolase of the HAD superfamily